MFTLTPQQDRLLRGSDELPLGVYQLYMTTAEQLMRVHYKGKSLNYIKTMLKQLEDNGYVRHGIIPTLTSGTPYYYMVGTEGVKYLRHEGYTAAYLPDMPKTKYPGHFEHQFELNDLLISGASVPVTQPKLYIHRLIPEHVMKRDPYVAQGQNGRYSLVPDGFIDFGILGTQLKRGILLEYDRNSEEHKYFQRRIRAYIAFLEQRAYEEYLGTNSIIVAFCAAANEARREEMRQWTADTLQQYEADEEVCYAFWFASIAKPFSASVWLESLWYAVADTPPQALLAM